MESDASAIEAVQAATQNLIIILPWLRQPDLAFRQGRAFDERLIAFLRLHQMQKLEEVGNQATIEF